jgi:hypothetical protein
VILLTPPAAIAVDTTPCGRAYRCNKLIELAEGFKPYFKNIYRPKTAFISTENADFWKNTEEISTPNVCMIRMFQLDLKKAIKMTKMYVLAKCTVTALCLYAISIILIYIPQPLMPDVCGKSPYGMIILSCAYVLMCAVFYLALLRNRGLVRRLAGPPKPDDKLLEMPEFVRALRITMVFCGLMLIPGALAYLVYLAKLPTMSRALLFAAFGSERFSNQLPKDTWALLQVLKPLTSLCLSAYLIIGAPAYIDWQVRKVLLKKPENDISSISAGEQK